MRKSILLHLVAALASLVACSSTSANEFPATHYASLTGSVRDSLSNPIPGVLVTLGPDDHFSLAKTTTGVDGHYSLLARAIFGQSDNVPDSIALPLTVYRPTSDSVLYASNVTLPITRAGDALETVPHDIAIVR